MNPEKSSPPSAKMQRAYLRVYAILAPLGLLCTVMIPPPWQQIVQGGIALGAALILAARLKGLTGLAQRQVTLPQIRLAAGWQSLLEIVFITLCLLLWTRHIQNPAPDYRLDGAEFSYLVNSGAIAHEALQQTGTIPLWNPFMRNGEPLFENPFSFLLNPFMSVPTLLLGAVQGTKVSVILHILFMGWGGWLWGRMLKLRLSGRVLLALLLGGSGSMAAAVGQGFYQMGLSQAYIPWVYAGVIGVVHDSGRRWTGLLVVATLLMIFAGTYWYVLTTAITVLVMVPFLLIRRSVGRWQVDKAALGRLLWAGLLIVSLAMIRLLPQLVHYDYVNHPSENLNGAYDDLLRLVGLFFTPFMSGAVSTFYVAVYHHYILPAGLVVLVAVLGLARIDSLLRYRQRLRFILPVLILIPFFLFWAQGDTPFLRGLYEHFPLLRQWRFVPRVLAAVTPLLAMLLAIGFDNVFPQAMRPRPVLNEASARLRWPLVNLFGVVIFAGVAAWGAADVLSNWGRHAQLWTVQTEEHQPLYRLRQSEPAAFLPVLTPDFFRYFGLYETWTRAAYGNPDYTPYGLPDTLGTWELLDFPPPYAVGTEAAYRYDPRTRGYLPVANPANPRLEDLWENPTSPTYSFLVAESRLEQHLLDPQTNRVMPLQRAETVSVQTYAHHLDSITLTLAELPSEEMVLVVMEVAYPGWRVWVNGEPAILESVGGVLGLRLSADLPPAPLTIHFDYHPTWFYAGAGLSLLALGGFAMYLLRLDRHLSATPHP